MSHVILNEWLYPFIARIINIHGSGVLVALCGCCMAGATWNATRSNTHNGEHGLYHSVTGTLVTHSHHHHFQASKHAATDNTHTPTLSPPTPFAKFGSVLLYVHRNRRLIRDGSPGRPPRLLHSFWVLTTCNISFQLVIARLCTHISYSTLVHTH